MRRTGRPPGPGGDVRCDEPAAHLVQSLGKQFQRENAKKQKYTSELSEATFGRPGYAGGTRHIMGRPAPQLCVAREGLNNVLDKAALARLKRRTLVSR